MRLLVTTPSNKPPEWSIKDAFIPILATLIASTGGVIPFANKHAPLTFVPISLYTLIKLFVSLTIFHPALLPGSKYCKLSVLATASGILPICIKKLEPRGIENSGLPKSVLKKLNSLGSD